MNWFFCFAESFVKVFRSDSIRSVDIDPSMTSFQKTRRPNDDLKRFNSTNEIKRIVESFDEKHLS